MEFTDNVTDAELLNGDMVDVYFDFNYMPGFTAKYSGTSIAEEPDEPEEYEVFNIRVLSSYMGEFDIDDANKGYVMPCLLEEAKSIYEAWAEAREESNAEDRQDLMNIAAGFM